MSSEAIQNAWRDRIREYESSGLTQRAWSAAHGVPLHQLVYWKGRFGTKSGEVEARWLPVEVCPAGMETLVGASAADSGVSLRVERVTIEVRRGFDEAVLRSVVQTLTGVSGDQSPRDGARC